MTNKEKYKQAFSVLHTSDHFTMEVAEMALSRKKRNGTAAVAAAAACILLAGGTGTAYAANVGGIQRTIQLWMKTETQWREAAVVLPLKRTAASGL